MYFTLPPGRAIRTSNSRVEWLALLTFLCCTVWPCRCNRRHAICILIARYFHEHTGTGTWVWPMGAPIAITTSTAAATYTTQRAASLYKNANNQYKYHLSNYTTLHYTTLHYATLHYHYTQPFQPVPNIIHPNNFSHSNITVQVLPSTFQFYKCLFPRQSPTDILYMLLFYPAWRYMQPIVADKVSLFHKCWVTIIQHLVSCYVMLLY